MIGRLVESAFATGYLSVASEGLLGQILETHRCHSSEMEALQRLSTALQSGEVRREALGQAKVLQHIHQQAHTPEPLTTRTGF